jgi:predicted nucleotidyltransferase
VDFRQPIQTLIPGVQGKVLAALAGTTSELNVRTIARVAGVSVAQASRVLPALGELGVIERREVPPSSLFRIVPEHILARALIDLFNARGNVLTAAGLAAVKIQPAPASIVIFGSFARGDGDSASDIDVIVVRPFDTDAEDQLWLASVEVWRTYINRLTGNPVEIIDIRTDEISRKLKGDTQLWLDVLRDGQVVFGQRLDQLTEYIYA